MHDLPTLINWAITNKCNLDCGFCFRFEENDISHENKLEIASAIIDSGVKRVTLTGGEPLLADDLCSLAELFRSNGIFCSLHTNGIITKRLKSVYRSFDRVSLSLDGSDALINEQMRGYSSYYEKIIESMILFKEKKIDFSVKTIATKKNIKHIPLMIPLIDKFKPSFWSIFEFRPIRIGRNNIDKFRLKSGEFEKLISNISCNTKLNSLSLEEASSYPIFLISGRGHVYTNDKTNGDIVVGNIFNNSIKSIWEKILKTNMMKNKYLKKYSIITRG